MQARRSLLDLLISNRSTSASDDEIVDFVQGFDGDRRDRHIFEEINETARYSDVLIGVAGTRGRPSLLWHS